MPAQSSDLGDRLDLALKLLRRHDAAQMQLEKLTARQVEVLKLVLKGYTYGDIAKALGLSIKTIEAHAHDAQHKLFLTRTELVVLAARADWA